MSRFAVLQRDREDEAELWRGRMQAFRNLYSFLSQIIPYQDSDLERLYVFLRHLAAKLPRRRGGPAYQFEDDVRLEYYRLQKISEGSISLKEGAAQPLDGPKEVGSGSAREEAVPLSQLVLVQLRDATDPETGQRYTVKRYRSEKAATGDSWRHENIRLERINRGFTPIVLTRAGEGELKVVAEFLEVLGTDA
jgi:hypothetical protein